MFPAIGPVSKLIKILHSDIAPAQIAGGVCFGMIMGLTPLWNLHNLLVLFLFLIIRVNLGSLLLSLALFSVLTFPVDPLSHIIGLKVLKAASLHQFWTALYNIPTLTWTNFNNSVVMGSLIISLLLFIPLWFGTRWFVVAYRSYLKEKIVKWKIVKAFTASKAYKWYARVRDWTG